MSAEISGDLIMLGTQTASGILLTRSNLLNRSACVPVPHPGKDEKQTYHMSRYIFFSCLIQRIDFIITASATASGTGTGSHGVTKLSSLAVLMLKLPLTGESFLLFLIV
jgi:hypothetical protein